MYTNHAQKRAQQRGIPPFINELLDRYGREHYDGRGGIILYLDKRSIRQMERDMGREPVRRLAEWHGAYKIISVFDGMTITVGKRYKRILH
ncbi:hypothetical protein MTYP_02875 [Methylophilaceae bacterium]|nr:hypothetical protein MTYP_02875 [Methylophilaceae bacterium]